MASGSCCPSPLLLSRVEQLLLCRGKRLPRTHGGGRWGLCTLQKVPDALLPSGFRILSQLQPPPPPNPGQGSWGGFPPPC